MICYECAEGKKESPAVGVCTKCGRGVCMGHLVWEEGAGYRKVAAGMGFRVLRDREGRGRIVCGYCAQQERAEVG